MGTEIKIWMCHNPHKDRHKAKAHSDVILQQLLMTELDTKRPFPISRTEHGKPFIQADLDFSISHCGHVFAYALSHAGPIGIDIERKNPHRPYMKLAQRYFHESETDRLQQLLDDEQVTYFFQLWTSKEAWCKQVGGVLWQHMAQPIKNITNVHLQTLHCVKNHVVSIASEIPTKGLHINAIA